MELSTSSFQNINDSLLETIEMISEDKVDNAKFDYTTRGKVKSINENKATVTINGLDYSCAIRDGIDLKIGDTVMVKYIQNNSSDKFIDGKLGTIGSTDNITGDMLKATYDSNNDGIVNKADVANNVDWSGVNNKPTIPTNVSQLNNDSQYVTQTQLNDAINNPNTKYTFNQVSPSSAWNITHNMNRYPTVTIVDSAGNVVIGDIKYISANQIQVNFTASFSGIAYLN